MALQGGTVAQAVARPYTGLNTHGDTGLNPTRCHFPIPLPTSSRQLISCQKPSLSYLIKGKILLSLSLSLSPSLSLSLSLSPSLPTLSLSLSLSGHQGCQYLSLPLSL